MERRDVPLFASPLATWERDGLKAALAKAGLPTDDVESPACLFWRFEQDDVPVGFGGLEIFGPHALLRSLVTLPPMRLRGFARSMVALLETEARVRGAATIYLLADGAAELFERLGYVACDRTSVPAEIAATADFTRAHPASAMAMMKQI
jgi:N-acetylglutamate synthase-like GNAT family acetyltransferase